MKVLLIGGTGLISTGITRLLLERGDEVWHYNRGQRSAEFEGRVTTITGNRYDHAAFEAQVAELPRFDAVVEMISYSVEDMQSLLRAFDGKCGHLVFCSTVDVYARPASTYPVTESEGFNPTVWDYAQKKAACERLLWQWQETAKQPFTVIRPVHTYSNTGAVLHTFGGSSYHLDRLKRGMPIIVHGDGTSLWSSVHRDDAAVAFANALQNEVTFGKSYHLPGDECVTWKQYHERVAEGIGAPKPSFVAIPTDLLHSIEPRTYISAINFSYNNSFDPSAAKADLGFHYTHTIAEGAREIYGWLEANNKIERAESVPGDDKIIAAWERLTQTMKEELAV
jgi:nucleoside-diphosphate-sugar epimerase